MTRIAYGTCVGPSGNYEEICLPSIKRFANLNSPIYTVRDAPSQFQAYNELLDMAHRGACDYLILLHDDVELLEDVEKILRRLHPIRAGLLGTLGGLGTFSLAWWRAKSGRRGSITDRRGSHMHSDVLEEVVALDDVFLVATRETIEHFRFPSRYRGFEGLGVIMASSVRKDGGNVYVYPMRIFHHNDGIGFNGLIDWRRNELLWILDNQNLRPLQLIKARCRIAVAPLIPARMRLRRTLSGLWPKHRPGEESEDPIVSFYIERWIQQARKTVQPANISHHKPGDLT